MILSERGTLLQVVLVHFTTAASSVQMASAHSASCSMASAGQDRSSQSGWDESAESPSESSSELSAGEESDDWQDPAQELSDLSLSSSR